MFGDSERHLLTADGALVVVERNGVALTLRAGLALSLTPLEARRIGVALVLAAHEANEESL